MHKSEPNVRSQGLYERARRVIPGGVNSPVRAFRAVGGSPLFIARGSGPYIFDVDGNRYLDFVGSWGPLILGHAHPQVIAAINEACRQGTTFGAPCLAEVELAERVVNAYPGLEQVRFVSSGTEATMSAIRLARAATGRDLIVKFSGCYHGHADHLLVAAGSGLATFGSASSAGVPAAFVAATRVLPLDDEQAVRDLFAREGADIAAVIIEPVPANHGLLLQRKAFLNLLRERTQAAGALLIFDEVISGFRVAKGGAAQYYGITPDMATFGKVIGGGMPVGAFGASTAIMSRLAPDGDTYQAGTLSGNPVAMAAGIATLDILERESAWVQLESRGARLEKLLSPIVGNAPFPLHLVRLGSLLWLSFHDVPTLRRAATLAPEAATRFQRLFHAMLARGIYIAPSAYEVTFVSLAHCDDDLQRFAAALAESVAVAAS
ncbi:MAG TPA: glutamate-1-semialdehyde 2,1-aminomutase [Steroidobacteraceae bacterium]|jgi:glutamate-1-semialdehyde 2,1-aminomutase|nr:glutamate-1-semialdehyde 2,1-aminomutase [Steroidobacteraceae bacterium]